MMQFHSKFSFLLLLCLMHICIEAKGTEHDEPLVTLDMKQTPIRKVLAEITRQTGVTFSYESSLTKHLLPIDITITAQPLSHCLRILFQKLPVEYIQSGKYIILKKKQKNIVISGFIRDKSSSESLIGASIYDAKSHQGTTSNADGFFSLTLEAGNDVYLNISYVGYDSFHRSFTQLEQDTLLPVLLNSHQQLAEVVVTGEYTSSPLVQTSDMGHTRLNKDLIQQTPVLFGEADIIKTLQTLPGVSAGTAGLAGMYVRGGNGDDNLYMIEGNPLYQINHVGGLFSSFNAEAVKDVEFFKSAFPARYGGRLSSVVDIHTKDGNMKEYHGSAMLGLTSGSLNLEGPLVKDRTSFNFALRRSWIDALSAPTIAIWNATRNKGETQIVARYAFTDMNFKLNYQFLPPSTSWEDKLTQGKGRSYGVELIARKEKGKITGWAGYTLSWNDRQFTEINKGKRFPAKFDNRHKFNIIANWKIKPKLELTGSWTYATGNRLTVSFENYQAVSPQHPFPGGSLVPPYIDSGGLDYYTERNNFQLPAYHRLDLGINIYRPKKKNRMGIWNISIYNVYSYMAPVSIRKGWWYNNDCFYTLGIVPIIPSVSYTYKF